MTGAGRGPRRRGTGRMAADRGGIALTFGMLLAAVTMAWTLALVAVVDLATTSGRAGTAADAAALAAMGSSPVVGGDGRPCRAAAALAAANGARLTRCLADAAAGWPLRAEVQVVAVPSSRWMRRLRPVMTGRAAAVARPTTDAPGPDIPPGGTFPAGGAGRHDGPGMRGP